MNASPAILIGASIPRSGHHFLERTLQRYFANRLHYCEFYAARGCCRQVPCTRRGAFDVIYQKSHDFDLALDPAIPGATYVIQHRHPVPNIASAWELMAQQTLGQVSDEYRMTRDNYAWWLAGRAIYYRRFHDKWVAGKPAGAFRIDYEDLSRDTAGQLAPLVHAVAGTVDEGRLAEAVAGSSPVRATLGVPFRPRQVDAASFAHPDLAAAFEEHVLRHGPGYGYAPMLDGGYEGSLLQGLILLQDRRERVPAAFASRDEAIEALAGRHPEIRLRRARALTAAGDPGAAAALLEAVLAESPFCSAAWQPLLRAWHEAGQPPKAAMATAEVMFSAMHDPQAVLALARIWDHHGRLMPAAAALHAAVGLHPNKAKPRAILATMLERLGRGGDAIAQAEAALAIDPAETVAQGVLNRMRRSKR